MIDGIHLFDNTAVDQVDVFEWVGLGRAQRPEGIHICILAARPHCQYKLTDHVASMPAVRYRPYASST